MSRLFNSGAETGDLTEWSVNSGTIAASTSNPLSGTYALLANPSAATGFVRQDVFGSNQTSVGYLRAWVRINTKPANTVQTARFSNSVNANVGLLAVTSNGEIQLLPASGGALATSPALLVGVWYCLELRIDGNATTNALSARINGVEFHTGNNSTTGSWARALVGAINPNNIMDISIDDVSVNDNAGGSENSYPGVRRLAYSGGVYSDVNIDQPTLNRPTLKNSTPHDSGSGGFSATHTISGFSCTGTDTLLLVWAMNRLVDTELTGITANGVAMTKIAAFDGGASTAGVALYAMYIDNASFNIVASTPTFKLLAMVAQCWENVDQSSLVAAIRQTGRHNRFSTNAFHRQMLAQNANTIIAGINFQNARTLTAESGWTTDQDFDHADSGMGQCATGYKNADGSGTTAGWTAASGDNFRALAFELVGTEATPPEPSSVQVKQSGTFSSVGTKVKASGSFVEAASKVRVGGVWV